MSTAVTRLNMSPAKVVAVDDSIQAMDLLAQILLGFGVSQTTKCTDVDEAKAALSATQINLVIVDEKMPGQDGFDLIAWIRGDPNGLNFTAPIMLATGNPTKAVTLKARDAGANYVISKPLVPGVLLSRMQMLARTTRDFVICDTYHGPDRRTRNLPLPEGGEERRADQLRLLQEPERALSQDEINNLFN